MAELEENGKDYSSYVVEECNCTMETICDNCTPVDDTNYLSIDDITNDDLKKWLNSIGRYLRDNLLITELGDKSGWSIRLYTAIYEYSVRARPNRYLGAIASCRSPRAGEKHTRGSDLSDGKFCFETWHRILCDIVAYEKVPLEIK